MLVKNHENIDFVENLHKISILFKIFENLSNKNLDVSRNFQKSWDWYKFMKISIFGEIWEKSRFVKNLLNYRFWPNFSKTLILVKIFKNLDLS